MEESARKKGVTQIYLWNRLKLDQSERSSIVQVVVAEAIYSSFMLYFFRLSGPPSTPITLTWPTIDDDDEDDDAGGAVFCFSWLLLDEVRFAAAVEVQLGDRRRRRSGSTWFGSIALLWRSYLLTLCSMCGLDGGTTRVGVCMNPLWTTRGESPVESFFNFLFHLESARRLRITLLIACSDRYST